MLAPIRAIGVPRDWSNIIHLPAKEGQMTSNIATIIHQHVSLEVRCLDRLYLQAYMPKLQTPGGLCYFLHDDLGNPIPPPALLQPDRWGRSVHPRDWPKSGKNGRREGDPRRCAGPDRR